MNVAHNSEADDLNQNRDRRSAELFIEFVRRHATDRQHEQEQK